MRKITLFLVLVCSISMFATRYLVQKGGESDATWRAAGVGETLVDLTVEGKSLNAWLSASFLTSFPAGDEIWLINGTYQVSAVYNIPANFALYGGFDGDETAIGDREKGANAWDFVNETIIDANQGSTIFGCASDRVALYDGLTFTKGKITGNSGAVMLRPGVVLRNSKFLNNSATGQGGAILMNGGGEIYDSYFYSNEANLGGAVHTGGANHPTIISGCKFENNKAVEGNNKQGGAIRSQSQNATIINSIFVNNDAASNGSAIYAQVDVDKANKIINCLVYGNKTKPALYLRGAAVYNSTVVDNEAGAAYLATKDAQIYNSVFWGEDNAHASVIGVNDAGIVFQNNAIITIPSHANWTISDNIALDVLEEEANYPHFANPLTNDWTITYSSPLLNAADKDIANTPSNDISGISRPQGSAYDIGAFELPYYNSTVTFNAGGKVNNETEGFVALNPKGMPVSFTIVPNGGMKITSVIYNEVDVTNELVEGVFTAPALVANATLVVQFDLETSVNDVNNSDFVCHVTNKSVILRGIENQNVNIFSISGALIFNAKSQTSDLAIPLSSGVYILKVADKVQKVIVR